MSTNKDKVILVVGGACGMGAATVCELYRQGAKLVVLDLNEEAWEELVEDEELTDGPGTIDFVGGDVCDASVRQAAIDIVKEKYGTLDSLLYIAGVLDLMCPAHKTDDELYDYVMDVNVNSCFRMCRDCLPLLWDHEGLPANIVIVGSVGGQVGSSAGAAYITSKHAVLGLARNLAHTYRFRNVRTNVVNPGACVTDILGNAMEKWPDRDIMDLEGNEIYNVRGAVALGVDWDGNNITGFPEDIANAILYLISDEAHYVNGAQLNVDGGWTSF
ncbi:MAG: SDR family oxidoreductase [Atopobiaceae bacterium]|nr:SDR family oxidoreductase [Atopobiaceae bacterium]MBR1829269.1 SDR family oxidoreductase [Atopobiaceae bacterium]